MRARTLAILFCCLLTGRAFAAPPVYPCRIIATHPHDPDSFTQGLFYHKGALYESSGLFGESYLAITEIATGEHLRTLRLPGEYFAEGITIVGDELFMLTWLSGTGFVHDSATLEVLGSFSYRKPGTKTEGWGITFGNNRFITSCGKDRLEFHRIEDFMLLDSVNVHDGDRPIRLLNELEFVGGKVLANIWKSDRIAVINPASGNVTAWIDLASLRPLLAQSAGTANGIAYDNDEGRLFVTGKNWDKLFEITVDTMLWRHPVDK